MREAVLHRLDRSPPSNQARRASGADRSARQGRPAQAPPDPRRKSPGGAGAVRAPRRCPSSRGSGSRCGQTGCRCVPRPGATPSAASRSSGRSETNCGLPCATAAMAAFDDGRPRAAAAEPSSDKRAVGQGSAPWPPAWRKWHRPCARWLPRRRPSLRAQAADFGFEMFLLAGLGHRRTSSLSRAARSCRVAAGANRSRCGRAAAMQAATGS